MSLMLGTATTTAGLVERPFTVTRDGDTIPGVLWTPAGASGPLPLVLMGHGGGSEKRGPNIVAGAEGLVRDHGVAAAAIDAPGHGERGGVVGRTPEYYALWADGQKMADRGVGDWKATLDGLLALGEFDADRVGWWGLSMGTLLGLPYVAADPRIKIAVLGLCSTHGDTPSKSTIGPILDDCAGKVTVPTLWMLQWDDERFERAGSLHLFDRIATSDKRLAAHPGAHGDMPEEGRRHTRDFIASRLREL